MLLIYFDFVNEGNGGKFCGGFDLNVIQKVHLTGMSFVVVLINLGFLQLLFFVIVLLNYNFIYLNLLNEKVEITGA